MNRSVDTTRALAALATLAALAIAGCAASHEQSARDMSLEGCEAAEVECATDPGAEVAFTRVGPSGGPPIHWNPSGAPIAVRVWPEVAAELDAVREAVARLDVVLGCGSLRLAAPMVVEAPLEDDELVCSRAIEIMPEGPFGVHYTFGRRTGTALHARAAIPPDADAMEVERALGRALGLVARGSIEARRDSLCAMYREPFSCAPLADETSACRGQPPESPLRYSEDPSGRPHHFATHGGCVRLYLHPMLAPDLAAHFRAAARALGELRVPHVCFQLRPESPDEWPASGVRVSSPESWSGDGLYEIESDAAIGRSRVDLHLGPVPPGGHREATAIRALGAALGVETASDEDAELDRVSRALTAMYGDPPFCRDIAPE